MEKLSRIAVHCDSPVIWTLRFPGAEWYCVKCDRVFGMLDVENVECTPELEDELIANLEGWVKMRTLKIKSHQR